MSDIDSQVRAVFRKVLKDISVEIGDEFDKNFERQAFFSRAWARRKSPTRPGGHILLDTSDLRKSIHSRIEGDSIVFYSELPYAAIHNEGGVIKVTERMKRYFRARFYESQGFGRRQDSEPRKTLSDGAFYAWTSKMKLNKESEFWRVMGLMKVGSVIRIPQRQFLGNSPEVEEAVREIIEDNLTEYVNDIDFEIR